MINILDIPPSVFNDEAQMYNLHKKHPSKIEKSFLKNEDSTVLQLPEEPYERYLLIQQLLQ